MWSASRVAGQRPAAHRPELTVDEPRGVVPAAGLRAGVEPDAQHVAALTIEVPGDEAEHVHEPVGERPVPAHVDARRHVDRSPRNRGEGRRHVADGRRVDPDDRSDRVGRVPGDECPQLVDVLAMAVDAAVETGTGIDLVDQRGEQEHVGARDDLQRLARAFPRRFRASRVDEPDRRTAGRRLHDLAVHVRDADEAPFGNAGVRAEHQQSVGVGDVGDRMDRRRAEHRLAPGELVGTVLRAGREVARHAELGEERSARRAGERVERARVPDVRGDGLWAVTLDHRPQVRSDPADGVVPRRPLPAVADAALWMVQPIGVAMDVERGDPLRAGEALAHRVVVVGPHAHDLSVVDRGDEAARRLAHPAERAHLAIDLQRVAHAPGLHHRAACPTPEQI